MRTAFRKHVRCPLPAGATSQARPLRWQGATTMDSNPYVRKYVRPHFSMAVRTAFANCIPQ